MKYFKNRHFTKRFYECIHVVACYGEEAPSEEYVECDEIEIEVLGLRPLYKEAGIRYFGYM